MIFLLPSDFHRVSVYPQKEIPFFILFTAALCSSSATLALLTYRFPEQMGYAANMVRIFGQSTLSDGINYVERGSTLQYGHAILPCLYLSIHLSILLVEVNLSYSYVTDSFLFIIKGVGLACVTSYFHFTEDGRVHTNPILGTIDNLTFIYKNVTGFLMIWT